MRGEVAGGAPDPDLFRRGDAAGHGGSQGDRNQGEKDPAGVLATGSSRIPFRHQRATAGEGEGAARGARRLLNSVPLNA